MHCHRAKHSLTHTHITHIPDPAWYACVCVCVFFHERNLCARVCMAKLDTLANENGCVPRTMYDIVLVAKTFYIMQIHPSLHHSLLTLF